MKISKKTINSIVNAIKVLGLTEEQLDSITTGNMDAICKMAQCKTIELMWYLRYER